MALLALSEMTDPGYLFSPRNIVKNSLKIQYLVASDDTADSVTVEYFSKETWQTAKRPSAYRIAPAINPPGYDCLAYRKAQAIREGKYMAAANRSRRLVTFQTERRLILTYGDLIAIAHDMPSWGQGAEVIGLMTMF